MQTLILRENYPAYFNTPSRRRPEVTRSKVTVLDFACKHAPLVLFSFALPAWKRCTFFSVTAITARAQLACNRAEVWKKYKKSECQIRGQGRPRTSRHVRRPGSWIVVNTYAYTRSTCDGRVTVTVDGVDVDVDSVAKPPYGLMGVCVLDWSTVLYIELYIILLCSGREADCLVLLHTKQKGLWRRMAPGMQTRLDCSRTCIWSTMRQRSSTCNSHAFPSFPIFQGTVMRNNDEGKIRCTLLAVVVMQPLTWLEPGSHGLWYRSWWWQQIFKWELWRQTWRKVPYEQQLDVTRAHKDKQISRTN